MSIRARVFYVFLAALCFSGYAKTLGSNSVVEKATMRKEKGSKTYASQDAHGVVVDAAGAEVPTDDGSADSEGSELAVSDPDDSAQAADTSDSTKSDDDAAESEAAGELTETSQDSDDEEEEDEEADEDEDEDQDEVGDVHYVPKSSLVQLEKMHEHQNGTKSGILALISDEHQDKLHGDEMMIPVQVKGHTDHLTEALDTMEPAAFLQKVMAGKNLSHAEIQPIALSQLRAEMREDSQEEEDDETDDDEDALDEEDEGSDDEGDEEGADDPADSNSTAAEDEEASLGEEDEEGDDQDETNAADTEHEAEADDPAPKNTDDDPKNTDKSKASVDADGSSDDSAADSSDSKKDADDQPAQTDTA